MIEGVSVVLLGLVLGIQHATDPDHVVAVAVIVSRTRRFSAGALIGALWGFGHTATIAAVGAAIILLGVTITPAVALCLELTVAVMLMGLGAARIAGALRAAGAVPPAHLAEPHAHAGAAAFHSHAHTHNGTVHRHPHVHPPERLVRALREVGPAQAIRSMAVGLVHGLAGSAAVALLVLATVPDPRAAVAYLFVFGAGTILGMTAITALLAVPFTWPALGLPRWRRAFAMGTGVLSLGLGVYLAVHIGLVEGLFLGDPIWRPR